MKMMGNKMKQNMIILLFFIGFSNYAMGLGKKLEYTKEIKILSLVDLCINCIVSNMHFFKPSDLKKLPISIRNEINIPLRNLQYEKAEVVHNFTRTVFKLKDMGFSADGKLIAVAIDWEKASKIKLFSLYDSITKEIPFESEWIRKKNIHTLKVLPESNYIIAGFSGGTIEISEPSGQTNTLLKTFINNNGKQHSLSAITAIALHHNNIQHETDYFISGSAPRKDSIRLWKMSEETSSAYFDAQYFIKALACLQQEAQFLVLEKNPLINQESALRLWDIATEKKLCQWIKLSGFITAMTLLHNDVLLTGTSYGYFNFLDTRADAIIKECPAHDCGAISSIAANSSNNLIVSGCENGVVKLWDIRSLHEAIGSCNSNDRENQWITNVNFAANGKKVAAVMIGEHLAVWDVTNFNQIAQRDFTEH